MKKLTGRQKYFFNQFLDIYLKDNQPIHYTTLAKQLGLGKITAYDMLRLLEDKGYVSSEYILPEGDRDKGRSTVLYRPTQKAINAMNDRPGADWDQEEWMSVKERILVALHTGKDSNFIELLEEIMQRIPRCKNPLPYVAETLTAVILNLYQIKDKAEAAGVFEYVRQMGRPGELSLNSISGLTMGLSLVEQVNSSMIDQLVSYSHRYEDAVKKLSGESRRVLADFCRDVMTILDL
jgi:hypothetical protein